MRTVSQRGDGTDDSEMMMQWETSTGRVEEDLEDLNECGVSLWSTVDLSSFVLEAGRTYIKNFALFYD
jgi:hypothetical protein